MKIHKEKIVVTGGAGFIGSNFVNKYKDKYDIVVFDSLTYAGKLSNLDDPGLLVKVDIRNVVDLGNAMMQANPDIIVNFAAESHVDNSIEMPSLFTHTNIVGTQNLLDLAISMNIKKFIQISTDEVYGHLGPNDLPFTEETHLSPRSPYSATKAAADLLVNAYNVTYGLHTCITRCSNNFGKNQNQEKLIPKIIHNAKHGKKIPIYGSGLNIRNWIYVEDHIDGIDLVINNGKQGEVYNFGGKASEISNLDLCNRILQIMNKEHDNLIEFVDDRKGHDFRYSINSIKAKRELGWEPKHDFNKSLIETVQYYL